MFRRVRASTYLLVMSMAINVWCVAMIALFELGMVGHTINPKFIPYFRWGLGGLVGYLFFSISKGRLQDLNYYGKWSKVLAFPLFAVVILPLLCFQSGPPYSNDFGDPPAPSGFIKKFTAFISFVVALMLVPYVMQLYSTVRGVNLHDKIIVPRDLIGERVP